MHKPQSTLITLQSYIDTYPASEAEVNTSAGDTTTTAP
jgi:hypothetical protein